MAPVSPGGQLSHTSAAPFFVAAAYGMPLDCLSPEALGGEGLGSLVTQDWNNVGHHPQGASQTAD